MPLRRFKLANNVLEVSWRGIWRDVSIRVDGAPIGAFPDRKSISAGGTFALPDGSSVQIQLVKHKGDNYDLNVLHNGQPLNENAGRNLTPGALLLSLFAVLNVLGAALLQALTLGATPPAPQLLALSGASLPLLIAGVLFLALAVLARRRVLFSFVGIVLLLLEIALVAAVLVFRPA